MCIRDRPNVMGSSLPSACMTAQEKLFANNCEDTRKERIIKIFFICAPRLNETHFKWSRIKKATTKSVVAKDLFAKAYSKLLNNSALKTLRICST